MIMADNQQLGGPLAYAYRYDQLHRIKQMQAWDNINTGSFSWNAGGSALTEYKTTYNYDGNGNLTKLKRHGNLTGTDKMMDSLIYTYPSTSNRLFQVVDSMANNSRYSGDFDEKNSFSYDNSGNLRFLYEFDGGGYKQTTLTWNHYGKVKEAYRLSPVNIKTTFGYGPDQNRVVKAIINTSTSDTTYTYYFRDAQGNVMAVYQRHEDTLSWNEQHLYGSARIGILRPDVQWYTGALPPDSPYFADHDTLYEGWKYYEISNHLGNVMATINDRKAQFDTDADDEAEYYEAAILSATDYYPFGFDMPGRKYQVGDYRYGFNGKEQDTDGEWGQLTHYDYGFRIYNPGIGKFLSVDPLTKGYPGLTPYQFASNTPIQAIDLDGLEAIIIHLLGPKARSKIDLVSRREIESQIEETMLSMDVNLDVKFTDQMVPMSKKDFQSQPSYHYNDSYVIFTDAGILKDIDFESLGWQEPGEIQDRIKNVGTSWNEKWKVIGAAGESAGSEFISVIDIENATSVRFDGRTQTDILTHLIEHESGHPKFRFHPRSTSDVTHGNVSEYGAPGHVSETILGRGYSGLGLGYDNYMVEMLQTLHGKASEKWHPPMSKGHTPTSKETLPFESPSKVARDAQRVEKNN